MAGQTRRIGRERAVQALFFLEGHSEGNLEAGLSRFWETLDEETPKASREFAAELIRGTVPLLRELDEAVQQHSENWRVERMARVDRNVLRVAAYELLHTETPARVVINEAIEVARLYGAEGSPSFVNGLLDKLARAHGKL